MELYWLQKLHYVCLDCAELPGIGAVPKLQRDSETRYFTYWVPPNPHLGCLTPVLCTSLSWTAEGNRGFAKRPTCIQYFAAYQEGLEHAVYDIGLWVFFDHLSKRTLTSKISQIWPYSKRHQNQKEVTPKLPVFIAGKTKGPKSQVSIFTWKCWRFCAYIQIFPGSISDQVRISCTLHAKETRCSQKHWRQLGNDIEVPQVPQTQRWGVQFRVLTIS